MFSKTVFWKPVMLLTYFLYFKIIFIYNILFLFVLYICIIIF